MTAGPALDASLERLVVDCREAIRDPDPRGAVRDVLTRVVCDRTRRERWSGAGAGLNVLYRSPDLTVLNVIWPPGMFLFPHDHRMWAAIAIYGGREDNAFYRRRDGSLVAAGGKELSDGAVLLLGEQAIHSVRNPSGSSYTGAFHVYGGDFVGTPRSQWDAETLEEQPYDLNAVQRAFQRAEQAAKPDDPTPA